jgi:signal peptidase II
MEGSKGKILKSYFRFLLIYGLVLSVILQIANFFIYKNLFFSLNPNFIFGLVQGNILAAVISTIILILFLIFLNKYPGFGFSLVIGGLISNIVDRFFYGGTIDYFRIWIIPTFNLADVIIIIGIILIVLKIIRTT